MALTKEQRIESLVEARETRARKLDWQANRSMRELIKRAPLYKSSGDLLKDLDGVRKVAEQINSLGLTLTYTNAAKHNIFSGFTGPMLRALIADLTKTKSATKGYTGYLLGLLDSNGVSYLSKPDWKKSTNHEVAVDEEDEEDYDEDYDDCDDDDEMP